MEKIKEIHHPWNSNIVEGFNKFITKFIPKDKQFNQTIEYKSRIHLAVCIDSIGYSSTYDRLFQKLGIKNSHNLNLFLDSKDKQKLYKRKYRQKVETKRRRLQKYVQKMKIGREKLKRARGKEMDYQTSYKSI